MENKRILVLGGGTAGWLTALYCRKSFPSSSITLVEDSEVGAIGVGEGTTPLFPVLLHEMGLDYRDVVKEARGSFKNGVSFENWNGDSKKFFHNFGPRQCLLNEFSLEPHFQAGGMDYYLKTLIQQGLDFNEYDYISNLSYKNKIDLQNVNTAIHFSAENIIPYLKNKGLERNIQYVDGRFSRVQVDDEDFITALCLTDGTELPCDFIFDCSGFSRLLIGNYYDVKWISYQDFLPMKRAIVFPLEREPIIRPYTRAVAMKYGWMWHIPLQDRIGTGYVFDSDFITEEEAVKEVEDILNIAITSVRSIPFKAGRYEKNWVKNCMAVGLSSNFVEPLEATSLHCVASQLLQIKDFVNHIFKYNANSIELFNDRLAIEMEDIANFIYLHYLTQREDTEFWREFSQRNHPPTSFLHKLNLIKETNLRRDDFREGVFGLANYLQVCNGLDLFKQPIDMDGYENLNPSVEEYKKTIDRYLINPVLVEAHEYSLLSS